MMEHDLFNDFQDTPEDELEESPLEERLEILKQKHFEKFWNHSKQHSSKTCFRINIF